MAQKQVAWNTGTGYITLTYMGQGDGPISVQSDENDGAARSQVVTIETTAGSPVVTKNLTISQAACPVPVGTILNYDYTGSYQEVELPAGQYKLQCWGAQGGSNAAASSYGITAKAGGKGGYSEGVLTLSQKTVVRVYVGGQGSSSAGGFNGGGSTTGSASYNSGNEQGVSRMGGGGGATDIRLSDGALLSRMIVAGGGSGGAMCFRQVTTTTTDASGSANFPLTTEPNNYTSSTSCIGFIATNLSYVAGKTYNISGSIPSGANYVLKFTASANPRATSQQVGYTNQSQVVAPSGYNYMHLYLYGSSTFVVDNGTSGAQDGWYTLSGGNIVLNPNTSLGFKAVEVNVLNKGINQIIANGSAKPNVSDVIILYADGTTNAFFSYNGTINLSKAASKIYLNIFGGSYATKFILTNLGGVTVSLKHADTSQTTESQVGFAGGGTNGDGYSSTYQGKQNAAGSGGSFGLGANQTATNYRYCSGAGGGGWYGGGGGQKSDSTMTYCKYSGGGSGWVNTAASANNRPSGYVGLQLDSGETKDGATSFPNTAGTGNETGHSGDGYARITRLA